MNIETCNIHTDTPELPTHCEHDPSAEDFETLTFSPEDDAKLARAARHDIIPRALAGDIEAMEDMRRLHMTYWQHDRGAR